MYLLDTDTIGILQRSSEPEFSRLSRRMQASKVADFFVSIVSFHEQVTGWNAYLNRARTPQGVIRAYQMFEGILRDFAERQVLPFDEAATDVFESLKRQRIRVGTLDLRIASIAIAKQMTLISRNLVDFKKVPGLDVEDWTTPI